MLNDPGGIDPERMLREGIERARRGSLGLADRVPVYAQMSQHSARLIGESTTEFFSDAETFLRSELAAGLYYEFDGPTIHYDSYNIEAEAMGARLAWSDGETPTIDWRVPLLADVDDYRRLRPFPMGKAGRMPYVLAINDRLRDMGLAPKVRFTGLFTLAANLLGLEELILATMTMPERVHALMRFLTHEIAAPWIVCQRERCGCSVTATGADALASPPLVPVPTVREFCLRYIRELEQLVGNIRLVGLWGERSVPQPRELLDIKAAGSPGGIQVLDPDVTALGPAFFARYASETGVPLVMGLDASLVGRGTSAAIESRARRFIEEAGAFGRFVLFINDIPADAPPSNVRAVVAVGHGYCADPSAGRYVWTEPPAGGRRWLTVAEARTAAARMLRT